MDQRPFPRVSAIHTGRQLPSLVREWFPRGKLITAALSSARDGSPMSVPGIKCGQQQELNQLARGLAAARHGRIDHQTHRKHEAFERSDGSTSHDGFRGGFA